MRLRTGRKVPRTLYVQHGDEPSDDDAFIGSLDAPWAARLVEAYNCEQDRLPPGADPCWSGCCPTCSALPGHQHPDQSQVHQHKCAPVPANHCESGRCGRCWMCSNGYTAP